MLRRISLACASVILVGFTSIASAAHSRSYSPPSFYFGGPNTFGYYQPATGPCGWYYYRAPVRHRIYNSVPGNFKYCSYWH